MNTGLSDPLKAVFNINPVTRPLVENQYIPNYIWLAAFPVVKDIWEYKLDQIIV